MNTCSSKSLRQVFVTRHFLCRYITKFVSRPCSFTFASKQVSSGTRGLTNTGNKDLSNRRTNEWQFDNVNLIGTLVLRTGPFVNYHISPLDAQEYPSQNKAFVKITSLGVNIQCTQDGNNIFVSEKSDKCSQGVHADCEVKVPVKYSCDAVLSKDRAITLESLESDSIKVKVDAGFCKLKSIQCGNANVSSDSGEIVAEKSLLGNIVMKTTSGNLSIHKVVGPELSMSVQSGNVHVKNLYSDRSGILCKNGNVSIGSCHRDCSVALENGNLKIDSIDGNLNANIGSGNIDVHIDNHKTVNLCTKQGNIAISLPESLASDILLQGTKADVDKKLAVAYSKKEDSLHQTKIEGTLKGHEEESRRPYRLVQPKNLNARTQAGSINLKCQDWFSSLNIPKLQR